MILIEDSRNKIGKHSNIKNYCDNNGIVIVRKVLNAGDYMLPQGTVAIDTKQSIEELAIDLHKDRLAFNKKYKKCLQDNIRLIVLVEEEIKDLNELLKWKSRHSRINGSYLVEMMHTIKVSYGVRFVFCSPKKTALRLFELLKE